VIRILAALIIFIQLVALALIIGLLINMQSQAQMLPDKIDLLVDRSQDQPVINLDCPKCPESKDYTKELQEIKKAIKSNNNQTGVYYYYSGCAGGKR
jgi:hypothetical protein